MKKYLFIAEKPSLMLDVQKCYKNHKQEVMNAVGMIDFIALVGHVCCYSEPKGYPQWGGTSWDKIDYPMIPADWKIEAINDKRKKEILKTIKESAHNYDGIIVGTDSDVEGYGIYYLVENHLGITDMKALRFIEHSLADKDILESLLSMTDYHEDSMHQRFVNSYVIRSRADWLYGMNGTREMSVKRNQLMTVGRVKAPTIKLVYDNSMAITNFKSRKYYQVESDYGQFTAQLMAEDGSIAQFDDKSKIKEYPLNGTVQSVTSQKVTEHAPKLYDLASAQADAGQKFGYPPSKTLEIIQSLYEKHKVISYPRTQCRYVSKAKAEEFPVMISHMDVFDELAPYVAGITDKDYKAVAADKQVVNDAEVNKEAHDALLPTSKRPVLAELNDEEKKVCQMIFTRLLAQFLPKAADSKTQAVIAHGDGNFITKGKVVLNQGWRVLYSEVKDKTLPDLKKGDTLTAKKITPVEKNTTPPKRLTQTTLLSAMCNIANQIEDSDLRKSLAESKGIGTPATRAGIIHDIINRGYVEEKKGGLYITELGEEYIQAVGGLEIVSPVFAAELDTEIKKVQRGEAEYHKVYDELVLNGLRQMCSQIEGMKSSGKATGAACPLCGGSLEDGRFKYVCEKGDFSVPKIVCGAEINVSLLKKLVSGEKSGVMQFRKKDGTEFKAGLVIEDGELKFDSSSRDTSCSCPKCNTKLKAGKFNYVCPECGFKVSRIVCGKEIDEKLLQSLLDGKTSSQFTFKKNNGTSFKAKLKLENGELSFDFTSGIQCPKCKKKDVTLNKYGAFCDEACGLKVFRKIAGKELTDTEMKTLLTKGSIKNLKGFKSKQGKEFDAGLAFQDDWNLGFVFENKNPAKDIACPECRNKTIKVNRGGAFCDCGLKIFRKIAGQELTDKDIIDLLTKGKTREISGFTNNSGKEFSASIILQDGKTSFQR